MPFPPQSPKQGPPGAMQGLAAAKPMMSAPEPDSTGAPPEVQAALGILKDAVAQFGPQIIGVLQQVLQSAGSAAPPAELGEKSIGGMGY